MASTSLPREDGMTLDNKRKRRKLSPLELIQKEFPNVKRIKDGKKDTHFAVTEQDVRAGKPKSNVACAIAIERQRTTGHPHFVARATLYEIIGATAYRYKLSTKSSVEARFFDEGVGFMPGDYHALAPHETQKARILRLLRQAGDKGVSKRHFYDIEKITQIGARIVDLQNDGCKIKSDYVGCDTFVTFFLIGETAVPLEPKIKRAIASGRNKTQKRRNLRLAAA